MLLYRKGNDELRFIGTGFIVFAIVLLPDPLKDLLQVIEGRSLGYLVSFWEECLEDTFPWAVLELFVVFGIVFFRRFVQTLEDNQAVSQELMRKSQTLGEEVATRQRLDQMFSAMLRTYRIVDLEQSVVREGQRYFHPHRFSLIKYDVERGAVSSAESEGPSPSVREIDVLQSKMPSFSFVKLALS